MYKNRYGDTVEFISLSEDKIWFKVTDQDGKPSEYWRFGGWKEGEEKKGLSMADPSGGPYIGVGLDMGEEDKQFKGKIVKYLTNEEGKVIIHV